jgi:4,5-dihydroxyphthalate decarboxylase
MNTRDSQAPETIALQKAGLFPVSLAMADYDRTRPIIDGRVKPEGLALTVNPKWIAEFCERPVYEEYDAAEMSLSWYLAARCRGEPVVALPIFPLRMPVFAYVLCRKNARYKKPADLAGKRIGVGRYRYTVNLWLRGIFKEHYGLAPEDVTWMTAGDEEAGFVIPPGIRVEVRPDSTPEELLARGEVDAVLLARLPDSYLDGKTDFRRLFPNARAEMQSYHRRTGIVPITHVIVMSQLLYDREPWIARSLASAFIRAQHECDAFYRSSSKHLSFPEAVFFLEEQRAVYGPEPWSHGLAANRRNIETFVRYAHEQGYIARVPKMEELFAPNTLSL